LKENETVDNLKNLQGLLRMLNIGRFSRPFISTMKELQKNNKSAGYKPTLPSPSHSHVHIHNESSSAMNLGKQFSETQNAQPSGHSHPMSSKIFPSTMKQLASQFSPEFMKQIVNDVILKDLQFQRQLSQADPPPKTKLYLKNYNENSLSQSQFSNPIHGSSITTGEIGQQIVVQTNFQPSQIAGISGHPQQRQYLPQHSDIAHTSSQIHGSGQQIQQSEMSIPEGHIIRKNGHHQTVLDSLNIPQPAPAEKQIGPFQSQQQIHLKSEGSAFNDYHRKSDEQINLGLG
jgi:hypothetical protein